MSEDTLNKISESTCEWLYHYCNNIYVYNHPSFRTPPDVRKELLFTRPETKIKVYRGINFGISNSHAVDTFLTAPFSSTTPVSTTTSQAVAEQFSRGCRIRSLVSIVISIEIDTVNVLANFSKMETNHSVLKYEKDNEVYIFKRQEKEVLLVPGTYSYTIESVTPDTRIRLAKEISFHLSSLIITKRNNKRFILTSQVIEGDATRQCEDGYAEYDVAFFNHFFTLFVFDIESDSVQFSLCTLRMDKARKSVITLQLILNGEKKELILSKNSVQGWTLYNINNIAHFLSTNREMLLGRAAVLS
jgi:hypothetical protein